MDNQTNKKVKNYLDNHEVDGDFKSLWKELEPRLPQQKRRSFIFPLLMCFFVLSIVAWFFISKNKDSSNHVSNAQIPITNIPNQNLSETILDHNTSIENNKKLVVNNTDGTSDSNITNSSSFVSTNTTISTSEDPLSLTLDKKIKDHLRNDNKALLVNSKGLLRSNVSSTTKIQSHYLIVDLLNIELKKLSDIERTLITLDLDKLNLNVSSKNELHSKPLEISIASSFIFSKYSDNQDLIIDEYGSSLEDMLDLSFGYGLKIKGEYSFRSGMSFGMALAYDELFENFQLDNSVPFDSLYYPYEFDGQGLGAQRNGEFTINQQVFNRNKYSILDIEPSISYSSGSKLKWSVGLFSRINIYQAYSGSLINEEERLIKAGNVFDERKINRFSLGLTTGIVLPICDPLDLKINLDYLNRGLKSSNNFKENRMNTIGIGLQLSYKL